MAATAANPVSGQAPRDSIDVLFIGNSYTYYNNLPRIVEAISQALEEPILLQGIRAIGGYTLPGHLRDGHITEILQESAPAGDSWDRVVLQEQSTLGVGYVDAASGRLGDPASFHEAARDLVRVIEGQGAEPLFYMTWAKESFPNQTAKLAHAYEVIGEELGAPVAPVGLAWERVRRERPGLELFQDDGSHPNATGSCLAACVIYAELTGRAPEGAPSEITGHPWNGSGVLLSGAPTTQVSLGPEVAAYLQRVAWEMVVSH
jgi:hypothetical protein